jgi:hypothetical protein
LNPIGNKYLFTPTSAPIDIDAAILKAETTSTT